ncbi:uncharacterized protein LOC119975689 isoform X1 [Scyliorhinus canicula]|uniref:uncharacterized protein LOC119975689 isoform X1 n=1 Tax=Scyliorhinus canicula TaxID=7830 RepID=UPI0018F69466|nr:uncharacterized protein LOC119975689 isoform X1 [Scyliorhinus canicula]
MDHRLPLLLLLGFFLLQPAHGKAGRKEVVAAIGLSVLLDPENKADLRNSEILWTFTGSDGNLVTILDYVPNHPIEEPNKHFKSRLHFNPFHGSLRLNSLKLSDQGVYTINVEDKLLRRIDLKLIEPLSEPLINYTYVGTTIILACQVSAGKATSIVWRKGVEVIKNGQRYQLVQNNSKLIISEPSKSDYGIYTCIVENRVSKNNQSYTLAISSIVSLHYYTKIFSFSALIAAVAAMICKIILFLAEVRTTSLPVLQYILQVLQFLFLIGAFVFWMRVEGASEVTVFTLVFLCLLTMAPLFLTCSMKACDTKRLNKFAKLCRLILVVAGAPLSGIIVISLSGCLITEIAKQADRGWQTVFNLQRTILPAMGILLVSVLISIALRLIYRKCKQGTTGTTAPSVKYSDGLHSDLKKPFLKPTVTNENRLLSQVGFR